MSRGFKRDMNETLNLRASGYFKDRDSFRSRDGHDLLGPKDKEARWAEIFDHYGGICGICGEYASPQAFNKGEWRHMKNEHNNFRRCDCVAGAGWAHHACHFRVDHPGPQLRSIPLVMAERGGA
jgi:hypothetical protein